MSIIIDDLPNRIAGRVRIEREAREWSLAEAADRSGVSKAMISKIERGESSPTTTVLGRLCGAFGITLSTFLTRAEGQTERLVRSADQPRWTDSESGGVRTLISPRAGGPIELVAVDLPPGAEMVFPASLYAVFHQLVWVLVGEVTVAEGETAHRLKAGDCLELGAPAQCAFRNDSGKPARYLVAASQRI